jgi:hypothetical protein
VLGSKAASSCFAAASSVPDLEYSVASAFILSLSSDPLRGYLDVVVWDRGRTGENVERKVVARKHCLVGRRKSVIGAIF